MPITISTRGPWQHSLEQSSHPEDQHLATVTGVSLGSLLSSGLPGGSSKESFVFSMALSLYWTSHRYLQKCVENSIKKQRCMDLTFVCTKNKLIFPMNLQKHSCISSHFLLFCTISRPRRIPICPSMSQKIHISPQHFLGAGSS